MMTFTFTLAGGHTTEILRLLESLSAVYTPRHYVIADTDRMSEDKIRAFEAARQSSKSQVNTADDLLQMVASYKCTYS